MQTVFATKAEKNTEARIVMLGKKACLVAAFTQSVEPVLWQVALDQAPSLSLSVAGVGPEYVLTLQDDKDDVLAKARFARHGEAEAAHAAVSACLLAQRGSRQSWLPSSRTALIAFAIFALLLIFVPSRPSPVKQTVARETKTDLLATKDTHDAVAPQETVIGLQKGEPQSADKFLKAPKD